MKLTPALLALGGLALTIASPAAPAVPLHTVSIHADGRDELRFSNGSLVVRHFSWDCRRASSSTAPPSL